jgi:hypothetical protein
VSRVGDEALLEIAVKNGGKGAARITGAMIAPMFVKPEDLDIFVGEQGYEQGHQWIGGSSPDFAAPDEGAIIWFRGAAEPDDTGDPWNRLTRLLEAGRCEAKIDYEDEEGQQQRSLIVTIGRAHPAEGDPTSGYFVANIESDVREALVAIGFPER